jgi:hypothetical protein
MGQIDINQHPSLVLKESRQRVESAGMKGFVGGLIERKGKATVLRRLRDTTSSISLMTPRAGMRCGGSG